MLIMRLIDKPIQMCFVKGFIILYVLDNIRYCFRGWVWQV